MQRGVGGTQGRFRCGRGLLNLSQKLDDFALPESDASVHAGGKVMVVSSDHCGQLRGAHQLGQPVKDMARGRRIEVAGRLVGKQQSRGWSGP